MGVPRFGDDASMNVRRNIVKRRRRRNVENNKERNTKCGSYHTKSQAESSYGKLNQAKLYFWPSQDVLGQAQTQAQAPLERKNA